MNNKEPCFRCGEEDEIEFMLSLPAGYLCDVCASDLGVTRSMYED